MNTYVVLLKRMTPQAGPVRHIPLNTPTLFGLATAAEVRLEKVLVTEGIFDAVFVCRAGGNQAMAQLLNGLDGWYTDCLIATERLDFENASLSPPGA